MLQIYDSLIQAKRPFKPLVPGKVSMYVCGTTVYDYCHIGHARTYVAFDVVYRYLQHLGYDVTYVRNITDIDDKIIARAKENKEDWHALTARMIDAMNEDFSALHILRPTKEPKATEMLEQMFVLIQKLIDGGFAYVGKDGDVFYEVEKYKPYGELSKRLLDDLKAGARVEINEGKKSPLDFVLWKQAKPNEPSWNSPWGAGRPGWHIECSAMSNDLLGPHFDIHGGGNDLKFPHHENERAQSEAANGETFVDYWMHTGFVQINDEKMSKSLNNFFTIRDVLAKHDAEVVRYFLVSSHYRSPVNYSQEALEQAHASLSRLYGALRHLPDVSLTLLDSEVQDISKNFFAALDDDFNLPEALASMFELAKTIQRERDTRPDYAAQLGIILGNQGALLGILTRDPDEFFHSGGDDAAEVEALIKKREQARAEKNWALADQIRDELLARKISIEDSGGTTTWRRM